MSRPVVGTGLASCCTIISSFGVLILFALGWAFDLEVEVLTGSTKSPKDPHAVAKNCYMAAAVYGAFVAFCACQVHVNKRYRRGAVRL
ncbi:hypothetical protein JCM6882_009166 [Rhodosporidiobolus microsporus]